MDKTIYTSRTRHIYAINPFWTTPYPKYRWLSYNVEIFKLPFLNCFDRNLPQVFLLDQSVLYHCSYHLDGILLHF